MKRVPVVSLAWLLLADFASTSLTGQAKQPAPLFRPALEQIQAQTRIPILLPYKLPSGMSGRDIKLAAGEVREDGYFISLFYSEDASNADYAAGFGASTRVFGPKDVPNTRA